MTPEQKAFFEYGKARLHVENARDILKDAILDCNLGFGILHDLKHEILIYKSAIRSAWNARKECRKWVPQIKRVCLNCAFRDKTDFEFPCNDCNLGIEEPSWICRWEPRKD